jgi:hypothetical protein
MKYPIGIQDFRKIREEGFVYVDKTEQIFRVLENGQYFFLSRPRRFGKSLLLSTIKELYGGQKDLFKGLWIEDHWDWEVQHPVLHLKFATFAYKHNPLKDAIAFGLKKEGENLGVELDEGPFINPLQELIQKTYQKYGRKVVLLVDEYDKPIIDYLDDIGQAEANREVLKNFYSVIKDSDPFLELVFITGVSAFSKVSIFSELNNLSNISLHRYTDTLLGITQAELEAYFAEPLSQIARQEQLSMEVLKDKVRLWYNGYSWNGVDRLYNPFSLLRFLDAQAFQNFWFETGTPTFLVKEMRKHEYYDVDQAEASPEQLTSFHAGALDPISVLFQTGYLTIDHFDQTFRQYVLRYPNQEVRFSMQQHLLLVYQEKYPGNALAPVVALARALAVKDLDKVVATLNSLFASIPYDLWQKENEHFYHALVHLIFSLLGTYIRSEVHSSGGRCDALVENEHYIYAFEFKLDGSAEAALQQIEEKAYLAPYQDSPKEKVAVGINFSTGKKAVEGWKMEVKK